jgi:dipeptide transport system substrate-binding protein
MVSRTVAVAVAFAMIGGAGAARAKTLVYCSEGSPESFSPMLNTTGTTFDANQPIYDRLLAFKPGTTEVMPELAESWDVSEDGKVYTFHLRHNVKWQSNADFKPARDFNADDVIFTFNRQWKADDPFHKVSGAHYPYFGDMGLDKLFVSIEKPDDYTVRFTLTKPEAPFLSDMAMSFAAIESKEYADALLKAGKPEQIDQQPIGTGPFELLQYQKDAIVRYRPFAGYWGTKPTVTGLVFSINTDPAVRLAKLRANECQAMAFPLLSDVASIKTDATLQLLQQPGMNIGYLAFNNQKKPFTDQRVRQAINMAIDRGAILQAIYQGAGVEAKNLIPPTMWSWDGNIQQYPHDPDQAKKLLAEAGFPDGFETTLWAMPVQRPYNPDAKRMAELMQSDLAKIGIKAKIVSFEWGEYIKRTQQGEHDMALLGWTGDNGDPDNFFTPLASCSASRPGGGSASKWCDHSFDDVIQQAAASGSHDERVKLYTQAQVIMHEQAPFFLIAHSVTFMPMRKELEGYVMSPIGRHDFNFVTLK